MRRTAAATFLYAVLACGGDDTAQIEETTAGTTSTTADAGTTTSAPEVTTTSATSADGGTSTGSQAESGTSDTTGDPVALEFARGIRLLRMTANQGVQVEIVRDGIEVVPEEYNTRLITGRRTLVRGFWSLHADFEPRELIGRLIVDYPDGTKLEQDFELMVESDSSDGGAGASFQWLLEPDEVVPGMQFRARILEPDATAATGEISDPPPIAPLSGKGTLEVQDLPLELKVVLVPVQHQWEDCVQTPNVTEDDVEAMRRELEQNNPVQVATFEVREPMIYNASIAEGGSFSPVLAALADLRMADDPEPNVYYYGLLDSCDGFPPGLAGQAIGIPEPVTIEGSQMRISTGRWFGGGAGAAGTFVHEVGHTQGRRHVRCSGGEAGVDSNYPHLNGRIGVWGFGIYDFKLRTPTSGRDYMTYCSNEWVSDYAWEQTFDVIELLTAYDYQDAKLQEVPMLLGLIHHDGSSDWWVTDAGKSPPTPGDHVTLEVHGVPIDVPASVTLLPHDDKAVFVQARLPEGSWKHDMTLHRGDGTSVDIAAHQIRQRLQTP